MDRIVLLWIGVVVGLASTPWLSSPWWSALCLLGLRRVWPLGLGLGVMLGHSIPEGPLLEGPVVVQGRVVAAPIGRQADIRTWACSVRGGPFKPCRGRVRVRFPEPVTLGSRWVVAGWAGPPQRPGLSGGPDPRTSAALSRIRTVIRASRARPLGFAPSSPAHSGHAAVLAAIATGDRRGVDPDTWGLLRDTGTAHLLAISGFHVGVVAGLVGGAFAMLSRWLALFRRDGLPSSWAWWIGALGGVAYAVSAGAPISAQRAAGVGLLAAVGRSLGREVAPLRLVGLVSLGVCVVDPSAIASPGFQLSFGAVLGLVRFAPVLEGALHRIPRSLRQGLVATTAATLGTLPAAAWWFQSLAPGSPVANLIAIPWMAVGVVPPAVGMVALPQPLSGWSEAIGVASLSGLFTVLGLLRFEALTPAVDGLGALALCGVFLRPRLGWVVTVLLLGLGLRSRPVGALDVRFFDVGQGDAALVQYPDGRRWLIDTGPTARLLPALRRLGVRRLDRLVVSHPDRDHAGGAPAIVCGLRVDLLVLGDPRGHEQLMEAARGCGVPYVVRGTPGSRNGRSLVVHASSPYGSALFTGDLDADAEQRAFPHADVLKVPHHGSRTSSSPELLDQVRPTAAVIPVGRNRYGHPHTEVLERYRARGIPTWRTDGGEVHVRLDADGLTVVQDGELTRFAITPNTTMPKTAMTSEMPWL